MKWVMVFLGGGVGSIVRYGLSLLFAGTQIIFPWPTLIANIIASALIGFFWMAGWKLNESGGWLLLAVGFCGGLSTFSAFSLETFQLMRQGSYLMAASYVLFSVLLCIIILFIIGRVFYPSE